MLALIIVAHSGPGNLSHAMAAVAQMSLLKAREFYVDSLGFQVDWVHRFEPGLPLYLQVSRDGCVLHLSEHHGDCSPGAAMRIEASDVDAYQAELASMRYGYARPGAEDMPWGTRDLSARGPFGNRLTFTMPLGAG